MPATSAVKKFPSRNFKKIASVAMGEPPKEFKELVKTKILKIKQDKLDKEFKAKQAQKEKEKAIDERMKRLEESKKRLLESKQKAEADKKKAAEAKKEGEEGEKKEDEEVKEEPKEEAKEETKEEEAPKEDDAKVGGHASCRRRS